MLTHQLIAIGLLSVLFLFKRTRYASAVYLVAYFSYLFFYSKGWIASEYYHAASATLNLPIILMLFKDYKFTTINDIFNLNKYTINQLVGLLSVSLVLINMVGYLRYHHGYDAELYNGAYRIVVALQISLLYIGNMINAWMDRKEHKSYLFSNPDDNGKYTPYNKLVMVRTNTGDYSKAFFEVQTEKGK